MWCLFGRHAPVDLYGYREDALDFQWELTDIVKTTHWLKKLSTFDVEDV